MKKNWKTTLGGLAGVILMAAGIFWPEVIDPETQQALQAGVAETLSGVGALVTALTLVFAKDADK